MTKSEQQRENILAVAREMFASKGFEATTTRELNNRLDIADGLLYYYFPHGKKQILDTIVKQGIQTRVNSIDVAFSDVTDASALTRKLVSVFDNMWDLFGDEANYQSFMITIRERALLSDEQSNWIDETLNSLQDKLADSIKQAPIFNDLIVDNADNLASIVVGIYEKTIYDNLLIRDQRWINNEQRAKIIDQIHLLVKLTVK